MQGELFPPPPDAPVELTEEVRQAVRLAQGGRCFRCGEPPARGGLDVVVLDDGRAVGLCRSDRLRWDARWRCAKAAFALRGQRRGRRPRRDQVGIGGVR